MKKIFIFIVFIVILLFAADKIYKFYSRNYINSHESIILINDRLSEEEVDTFFNLNKGTYDSNKHRIIYSLIKKDANLLDTYINLPTKYKNGFIRNDQFNCDIEYSEIKHYGFYNYEIGNTNIIARIISKDASVIKQLNPEQIISEKYLGPKYKFGEINILDISKNGVSEHCK